MSAYTLLEGHSILSSHRQHQDRKMSGVTGQAGTQTLARAVTCQQCPLGAAPAPGCLVDYTVCECGRQML